MTKRQEPHLISEIEDLLRREKLNYQSSPKFGGVEPDFLVRTPKGGAIVIDVKYWNPNKQSIERAKQQARLYQTAVGANSAFVVLDGLKNGRPDEGVITIDELIPALREAILKPSRRQPPEITSSKKRVFAAMPFSGDYDDVYFVAMVKAAAGARAVCKRVDKEEFVGDIVEKIEQMIRESDAVIVDLSESKPNVLYEAGFARALNIPCVHICSTPIGDLPFDVSHKNTMAYTKGQTTHLRAKLTARLKTVLKT
jgi:hypothetical protein